MRKSCRLILSCAVGVFLLGGCGFSTSAESGVLDIVDGRFLDTPKNRAHFEEMDRQRIEDEIVGRFPNKDWRAAWHLTVRTIEKSFENPAACKKRIRELRREAGVPVWDFMY